MYVLRSNTVIRFAHAEYREAKWALSQEGQKNTCRRNATTARRVDQNPNPFPFHTADLTGRQILKKTEGGGGWSETFILT